MTAQIINFPIRSELSYRSGLDEFATLPSNIKDLVSHGGYLFAACDDGLYVIDKDGSYEKVIFE